MLQNPNKIDQKISSHYDEIKKLEEMKQRALAANQGRQYPQHYPQQYDSNPIICHQTYSQNYHQEPAMQGTLVNENYMPRHQPQQAQYGAEQEMS